jgi:hypothetical protein
MSALETTDVGASLVALRSAGGVALMASTVLATLVGVVDASVVNVAVPAIGRDLGASVATLQWTLTGYLVTVASLLLLAGSAEVSYSPDPLEQPSPGTVLICCSRPSGEVTLDL